MKLSNENIAILLTIIIGMVIGIFTLILPCKF
jgi:hypothetical protein